VIYDDDDDTMMMVETVTVELIVTDTVTCDTDLLLPDDCCSGGHCYEFVAMRCCVVGTFVGICSFIVDC
jgi:hypothetical protein